MQQGTSEEQSSQSALPAAQQSAPLDDQVPGVASELREPLRSQLQEPLDEAKGTLPAPLCPKPQRAAFPPALAAFPQP